MQRGFLAVVAAALFCGLCYLGLKTLAARGETMQDLVLLTCGVTLALSIIAAVFSARALSRANAVHAELSRVSRSADAAMRELSQRSTRDAATLDELSTVVAREVELFSQRPSRSKAAPAESAPQRDNIVALASSRRSKAETPDVPLPAPVAAGPEQVGFELAVQRAYVAGDPDISLQPIVSIAQGAATGFEVFAHVNRDDGMSVDLQRLPYALPTVSTAGFERWLVLGAISAGERQFGQSESLPLHVQISEALLSDSDELNAVVEALRQSRTAQRTVVLSMPSTLLERNARHVEAIEMLVEAGARLAAESWSGNREALEKMKRSGVSLLKLTADRLLGRTKVPRSAGTPIKLLETAGALDIPIIAVNVGSDEDAVGLIDLGINLMTGNRFSGPRRLKPQGQPTGEARQGFRGTATG